MFLLNLQNTNIVESTLYYTSSVIVVWVVVCFSKFLKRGERFVHSTYGCNSKVPRDLK